MKRCDTPWRRSPEPRALLVALLLLGAGACMSRTTHDEVVRVMEARQRELAARAQNEERSNQALSQENLRLVDALEDMRQTRDELALDHENLRQARDVLSGTLRDRDSQLDELFQASETYRGLVADLQSEVTTGQIEIQQLRDGIRLNLPQRILFASGSVDLDPRGAAVLRKVSARLASNAYRIEVRGHSDDEVLIRDLARRFGTNWELAGARASRVVRLLQEEGIDGSRMIAISYGPFAPVASNETPEGRARNRRIEIRLVPDTSRGDIEAGTRLKDGDVAGDS